VKRDIAALVAFLDGRQATPHAIGSSANDCVSFALGAAAAVTGEQRAAELEWHSAVAARRLITRLGGLEAAFDRYFVRTAPAMAMRGDIAGVADPELGIHPMVVEGLTLVGPGERGNRRLPRSAMVAAWSVTLPRPDEAQP
jgi:hypothetical protein